MGSGTAALTIMLRAGGIGAGDEVIVPAHTFTASALGVIHAGATPVFCDVDDGTGLVDLESAARVVGPRTAALMVVHLYGQVCDMDRGGGARPRSTGWSLFEDAAQAHGARWGGRAAGSFGRAGAFSFYPSKNLGAFGDGGMICTTTPSSPRVRVPGATSASATRASISNPGYNERLDTLQAAVLACKLPHLDGMEPLSPRGGRHVSESGFRPGVGRCPAVTAASTNPPPLSGACRPS